MNDSKNNVADPTAHSRLTRLIRIELFIYVPAVLVGAPAVLGLFGYGLAHASDQSIAAFLCSRGAIKC